MNNWINTMSRVREDVLSTSAELLPVSSSIIRPTVYESWRRSRLQGLEPGAVSPAHEAALDVDNFLSRTAAPIIERRRTALTHGACALVLSDRDGRILRRWAYDRSLAAGLDVRGVAAGFTMDESTVGTTGLISLMTGAPELIRGPEHFSEEFHDYSCATAPIVHPVKRSLLGSVSLVCRLMDTAPIMLSWVMDLVLAIEDVLRIGTSLREQRLFDAYTRHNRDIRHPLVALDMATIITNAAAARLLGGVDQSLLWEHARRCLSDHATGASSLTLQDGQTLNVECRPVSEDDRDAGAILILREDESVPRRAIGSNAVTGDHAALFGLVGQSKKWLALCRQATAHRDERGSLLVAGEPGSGRLAVARAILGSRNVAIVDAADAAALGEEAWCQHIQSQVDNADKALIIRHLDYLNPSAALMTLATLRRTPPARLLATAEIGVAESTTHNALLDSFESVIEVPPLRERLDDFPALLRVFTEQVTGGTAMEWTPASIQALTRLDWPGNLNSLYALVRRTVAGRSFGQIVTSDLPPSYLAKATRRQLATLERTEARTILQALRESGGNKQQAALSLGIARSTLYRKVRALGIDLSSTIY
ncbi:helix-turn-helix domain-containing protein [Rhodococcus ruber]|uniref:helix-turn-helix domain-containing protein n=1 Tax=Rhodococcus ruber TaxID=1830 RepID=UPI00265DB2AD|nr:helix-turn-helix domain-containing protein [Rhodococcus ruber]MDO1481867.1 Fis family transcriptional regulator [Rhodococcus ruber]